MMTQTRLTNTDQNTAKRTGIPPRRASSPTRPNIMLQVKQVSDPSYYSLLHSLNHSRRRCSVLYGGLRAIDRCGPRGKNAIMFDPVRQEIVALAHTVVVKVGTNVLADADGRLDRGRVRAVVDQLLRIRATGKKVALVSSGAIGAGIGRLGLPGRPSDLRQLQACAAVGQ